MERVRGQVLRLREDFCKLGISGPGITSEMEEMASQYMTVRANFSEYNFGVEENGWTWDIRWFEEPKEFDVTYEELESLLC